MSGSRNYLTGVPGLEAGLADDKEPIYFVIL
jgi:hypothetical protein